MSQSYRAVRLLSDSSVFLYTKEEEPRQSVLSLETQAVFGCLKKRVCQTSKYVLMLDNFTELSLRTELFEFLSELHHSKFVCMLLEHQFVWVCFLIEKLELSGIQSNLL